MAQKILGSVSSIFAHPDDAFFLNGKARTNSYVNRGELPKIWRDPIYKATMNSTRKFVHFKNNNADKLIL